MREEAEDVVGGSFWHTTEEIRTERGRERAHEFLTVLGTGAEPCIVALASRVRADDVDAEAARRDCFRTLLPALQNGGPGWSPTRLAVLEQRRTRAMRNRDAATHKLLVSDGTISRHFQLLQASPADEHLLWLPDLVASAVRRDHAHRDRSYVEHIKHNLTIL